MKLSRRLVKSIRATYVLSVATSLLSSAALAEQHGARELFAINHAQPTHHSTLEPSAQAESPVAAVNHLVIFDQFEYQDADAGSTFVWDASAWFGTEQQRLWLTTAGERTLGVTAESELQMLYGHVWDGLELVAGVRQDFKPATPQTWRCWAFRALSWERLSWPVLFTWVSPVSRR